MAYQIRHAKETDWKEIQALYATARQFMADHGNPDQWGSQYPPDEMLLQDIAREKELINALVEKVSALAGVKINGAHQAPHILSLSIPGVPTQNTINILQDAGICVSAGSACAKGHRSHTLTAIGLDPETMDSSFRVSISRETTSEDLQALLNGLLSVLDWIKR